MIHQDIGKSWHLLIWFAAGILCCSTAMAQNAAPPSLAEQLKAQYMLVKMGRDAGGLVVTQPGTVLVIQKGGILGVPYNYTSVGAAKYQDGLFHPSTGLKWLETLNQMSGSSTQIESHLFQTGDKVYPLKIDVNLTSAKISFGVVCDSCNGTNPPTFYKGEVNFQFAKGYLEKTDVSQIEDTIGQVFALDNGNNEQQAQAPAGPPDQGQVPAQAAPPSASAGLTNDDVIKLVQNKLPDSIITKKIKNSACSFNTSADGLVKLKQAGVRKAVIEAMVDKQ